MSASYKGRRSRSGELQNRTGIKSASCKGGLHEAEGQHPRAGKSAGTGKTVCETVFEGCFKRSAGANEPAAEGAREAHGRSCSVDSCRASGGARYIE